MTSKPSKQEDETEDIAKKEKGKSKGLLLASQLTPASQSKMSPEGKVEHGKAEQKMRGIIEWYRKEISAIGNRASGRVTPAILDPVRVTQKGHDGEDLDVKLTDVATVGVKEGSVLVVTAFDENNLKPIDKAIYKAGIPNCVPHKVDTRTLRIPIPRPTIEDRKALVKSATKLAEDTKVKLRAAGSAATKAITKLGFDKQTHEIKETNGLTQKSVGEVDDVLKRLDKDLGT